MDQTLGKEMSFKLRGFTANNTVGPKETISRHIVNQVSEANSNREMNFTCISDGVHALGGIKPDAI